MRPASSERDFQILARRFGGTGQPPQSLIDISKEFNLTRQRIEQIVKKSLGRWLRGGKFVLGAILKQVDTPRRKPRRPLAPERLLTSAPEPWPLQCTAEFYARVIAELRPDIPAARRVTNGGGRGRRKF